MSLESLQHNFVKREESMSQMDATTFKVDLNKGTATEMVAYWLQVSKDLGSQTVQSKKEKEPHSLSVWLWYALNAKLVSMKMQHSMNGYEALTTYWSKTC
jgi:hypothetical protein